MLLSICIVVVFGILPTDSLGQSAEDRWQEPVDFTANTDRVAWNPQIAADSMGNLHLIWRGWTGPDIQSVEATNTLFYAWWNGVEWSKPVDVITTLELDRTIINGNLSSTADGRIVVTWWPEGTNQIYVSQAVIGEATNAQAWSSQKVDQGTNAKLAVDSDTNRWHLTYTRENRDVVYTYSDDGGTTWATEEILWSSPNDSSAPRTYGINIADDKSVHVTWSEYVEERNWSSEAIWHARLPSSAQADFEVREVARSTNPAAPTLDSPVMAAGPGGALHLFWNNGIGSTTGRFHQWSLDNGLTWSEVQPVFPGLSGQTGQAGLAFDSAGVLHLVTAANGDGYLEPLRHATWQNGAWSSYETLWPDLYEGEFPSLAVTDGNRLHLVWQFQHSKLVPESKPFRKILYSSLALNTPTVSPVGFEKNKDIVMPVTGPIAPTPNQTSEASELPKVSQSVAYEDLQTAPDRLPSTTEALAWSIGSALVIVLAVIGFNLRRTRTRG